MARAKGALDSAPVAPPPTTNQVPQPAVEPTINDAKTAAPDQFVLVRAVHGYMWDTERNQPVYTHATPVKWSGWLTDNEEAGKIERVQ